MIDSFIMSEINWKSFKVSFVILLHRGHDKGTIKILRTYEEIIFKILVTLILFDSIDK